MKTLLRIFAPLSTSSPDFANRQGSGRCTQVQMAVRLGLDRSYLADAERGKRNTGQRFGFALDLVSFNHCPLSPL
jgi:hypothetical protein